MALEVSIKRRLKGFSLNVSFETNGEVMGLLGASGSGKSMTLRCIAGVETPDEGRIVLNGEVLFDSNQKINLPPRQRNVGYLFQNYALFPTMTTAQNIGISLHGSKSKINERVNDMIRKYRLTGLENRFPTELSGGQQQRVALARMLITDPAVVMLDEPFSALDAYLREQMLQELLQVLKDYKGEVILVSHSRDDIYKCCRNLTIISGGDSLMSGETRAIFRDPRLTETCRLTGCKNISKAVRVNDRRIYACDWKTELVTVSDVPEDLAAVGIRGHMIRKVSPDEKGRDNCVHVHQTGLVDAPFEYQYLLQNVDGGDAFWWMLAKKDVRGEAMSNFDGFVELPAEDLMLLRE